MCKQEIFKDILLFEEDWQNSQRCCVFYQTQNYIICSMVPVHWGHPIITFPDPSQSRFGNTEFELLLFAVFFSCWRIQFLCSSYHRRSFAIMSLQFSHYSTSINPWYCSHLVNSVLFIPLPYYMHSIVPVISLPSCPITLIRLLAVLYPLSGWNSYPSLPCHAILSSPLIVTLNMLPYLSFHIYSLRLLCNIRVALYA